MSDMIGYAESGLAHPMFVRRNNAGQYWNTSGTPAFENWTTGNVALYGIVGTEDGVTGNYTATDPASTTAGQYLLLAAAGASLTVADVANNKRWQDDVSGSVPQTGDMYGAYVSFKGTATAGGANTITLQTALPDNLVRRNTISINSGTGAGQTMQIASYVNATRVVTVDQNWEIQPDNTSVYLIFATDCPSTDSSGDVTASNIPGGGSGAWTVTLTVTDGTNPLEHAWVRLTSGADSYPQQTNASGIAVFHVNSATWNVIIALSGYTFVPVGLGVAANVSQPYAMTPITITASPLGQTTGFFYIFKAGIAQAGVAFGYSLVTLPTGGTGTVAVPGPQTATSDSMGFVQMPLMFPGAAYLITFGNSREMRLVPASAGSSFALPNIMGT